MNYTNSNPEKRIKKDEPIVKRDRVVSSKESLGKKIVKEFFEDDIKDVKQYILWEKVIPGIKNLILDGLEKLFFKDVHRSRSGRTGYDYNQSSYQYYYKGSKGSNREEKKKSTFEDKVDCQNVVLDYREDAENLIRRMKQIIREDGEITVARMFDLIDCPSDYIDNNWGWDNERDIGIRRVSTGYLIDVREPKYLGGH